ncbi:hypothetical protein M0R45_019466 [Rubus argutus]|uniref:Uncharacterized protein n=1 Tax=Rubus argutus TaxID=59490 RepID=A0AAW1X949_RUBAR
MATKSQIVFTGLTTMTSSSSSSTTTTTSLSMSYANEDPEKILEQAVLKMNDDLTKMRQASGFSTKLIAGLSVLPLKVLESQKRLENKYRLLGTGTEKHNILAVQKEEEDLACEALKRCKSFPDNANSLKTQLDQQKGVADNLVSNTKVS